MSDVWFKSSFHEASQAADNILFNVTGFDPCYAKPGLTSHEFSTIINDASLLEETTFVRNGDTVASNRAGFVSP